MARRAATGLKAKPKKIPLPRTPKMVDTKYLGLEPEFDSPLIDNDTRLNRAYGWYNHFYGLAEAKKWTLEHYETVNPKLAKDLARVPEALFSSTVGWLCRMESNGAELAPQSLLWRSAKIGQMIKNRQEVVEEVMADKVSRGSTYKPAGYLANVADLEDLLDAFYVSGYKDTFVPYDYLVKIDVKKTYAIQIANHFRPLFDEIRLLLNGKDKDLNEAYKDLTKAQKTAYQKLVFSIIEDCDRWSANKTKTSRAVRAPKKKSSEQLLKTFKYMKDNSSLKIVSIDPASIIGASVLVAYNHKYKKLILYNAKQGETLSVKGASITGFDEATTSAKTLRKPEIQLESFTTGTQPAIKRKFEEVKTTPSQPSGRISEDVLLIKVFK